MPSTYNPNIPQPNDVLDVSQGDILKNFMQLDTTYGIDHFKFSDGTLNNGYHQFVHLAAQLANPATVATTDILFSKSVTPDSTVTAADVQLFNKTGNGGVAQMTGRLINNATDGYVWISGMLLQWGFVTVTSSTNQTGNVVFKDRVPGAIPFPNKVYLVQLTPNYSGADPNSGAEVAIKDSTLSITDFDWYFTTNSGAYSGFYWIALGY